MSHQTHGERVLRSSIGFLAILLSGSVILGADIRLGIVSTDTSHVLHFTRILNEDRDPEHVPGARVVAAYKGGSPDIPSSRNRVDGFEHELIETYHGFRIIPTDGRPHRDDVVPSNRGDAVGRSVLECGEE